MKISRTQKRILQIKFLQCDDNIPKHKNRKKTTKRYAFTGLFSFRYFGCFLSQALIVLDMQI